MTKKERTIKACRELAAKYREPEGKRFFVMDACPLCPIHHTEEDNCIDDCRGCPLGVGITDLDPLGCVEFASSQEAAEYDEECGPGVGKNPAFNARAAFFDKIIPILEELPAKRFTKRGWEYFDMLDRSW